MLVLGAVAAPAIAVLPASPAAAGVDDFEFESFDARYELGVLPSGVSYADATETIVARFPDFDQNRGIVRAIPTAYNGIPLDLSVDSVTDAAGVSVPYEREDADGFAELSLGTDEYVHGRTTYVISYRVVGPIRDFEKDQEFYWDVNGTGWVQPFDRVTATVVLSPELAPAARSHDCYAGWYGESVPCDSESGNAGIFEFSSTSLGPGETLTVVVGFEPGTVLVPPDPRQHWLVTIAPWVVALLAVVLLALAAVLRAIRWRDPRPARAIIAEYAPPPGSLLVHAEVIRRRPRAIPAALIDAAVRGAIRIIDLDPDRGKRLAPAQRYLVEVVDASRAVGFGGDVLSALTGGRLDPGVTVNPGAAGRPVGAALYALTAAGGVEAARAGLIAPAAGRWARVMRLLTWLAVALLLPSWAWCLIHDIDPPILSTILVVVLAIVSSVVLSPPKLLTVEGAAVRDGLVGLRLYLTVAEEDRIRMLQSPDGAERGQSPSGAAVVELYERLLPYAVLWGVEEHWAAVLGARYAEQSVAPNWSSSVFDGAAFAAFSRAATVGVLPIPTAGSSWSGSGGSSFSGGSGGGGFSGGGGGGGGGGGR